MDTGEYKMRNVKNPSYELETGDVIKWDCSATLYFVVELPAVYLVIGRFGTDDNYPFCYSSYSKGTLNTLLKNGTIKFLNHLNSF